MVCSGFAQPLVASVSWSFVYCFHQEVTAAVADTCYPMYAVTGKGSLVVEPTNF